MKVGELIEELSRYDAHENIAVEVTKKQMVQAVDSQCDTEVIFDIDLVQPENLSRHSLKITLI